jgi:hypothetical protein
MRGDPRPFDWRFHCIFGTVKGGRVDMPSTVAGHSSLRDNHRQNRRLRDHRKNAAIAAVPRSTAGSQIILVSMHLRIDINVGEHDNPPSGSVSATTTYSLINARYLNNTMRKLALSAYTARQFAENRIKEEAEAWC